MLSRRLRACAFALLTTAACSSGGHDSARVDSAPGPTTREMSQALTRDGQQSDHELAALQDSLYALMGDTVSAMLKQARANWEQYRKLECDAVRGAFTPGTMAPIAQMECWVKLTDDHRRFLKQFGYMRPPPPPTRRNP